MLLILATFSLLKKLFYLPTLNIVCHCYLAYNILEQIIRKK
jgi:hypothetical protein